jgi:hypothetical protein
MSHRLLFASIHSYLDPSSGAALATRELLELLAARGWDCRAFTCGVLDYYKTDADSRTSTPLSSRPSTRDSFMRAGSESTELSFPTRSGSTR